MRRGLFVVLCRITLLVIDRSEQSVNLLETATHGRGDDVVLGAVSAPGHQTTLRLRRFVDGLLARFGSSDSSSGGIHRRSC